VASGNQQEVRGQETQGHQVSIESMCFDLVHNMNPFATYIMVSQVSKVVLPANIAVLDINTVDKPAYGKLEFV
jgi:hypothetical protein